MLPAALRNEKDAGIAFLESMNAKIYDNTINNVKYGIRMSLGSAGNVVSNNLFNGCSDYGLYTYEGSDAPTEGVSNGRPSDNLFDGNVISNSAGGVKFKYSDNLVVSSESICRGAHRDAAPPSAYLHLGRCG